MFPVEALVLEELVVMGQMSPLILVGLHGHVHGNGVQVEFLEEVVSSNVD